MALVVVRGHTVTVLIFIFHKKSVRFVDAKTLMYYEPPFLKRDACTANPFPVMTTGISLCSNSHREFPVMNT